MKIPAVFKQLFQKRNELNQQFKLMKIVLATENYIIENLQVLRDMEKTLHDMLDLIEKIKQSHNRGQQLPGGPLGD
jgi:hypothetical protein